MLYIGDSLESRNVRPMALSWTCPHCERPTTVTDQDVTSSELDVNLKNPLGPQRFTISVVRCPNPTCKKLTVHATQFSLKAVGTRLHRDKQVDQWRLIPQSAAKVFPDYVPKPIRSDYEEACLIVDKSPKASATLSRRCLQGMIRDFHGISKGRLIDEVNAIKDRIDPLTWEAIDAVRSIGNIGAHMEKDINLIIDVDEGEAQELIRLIELLISDWYITRHNREVQLESIKAIKSSKDVAKSGIAITASKVP